MAHGPYIRTKYLNSSLKAFYSALDSYNRVVGEYRNEQSVILMTNAVELIAKSLILKLNKSIKGSRKGETISAEKAVLKLQSLKEISSIENQSLQQLISMRNEAIHGYLPIVHNNIMQHLMYTSFKIYKQIIEKHFRNKRDVFKNNFLSISLEEHLTYADSVESLLKNFRRGTVDNRKLACLLERGVSFNGSQYMPQEKFEKQFLKSNAQLLNRVKLGDYIKNAEQLKIIFVQAPKGYTANVSVRKGGKRMKEALPVMIKKTEIENDYPYLTGELAEKLGKNLSFVSKMVRSETKNITNLSVVKYNYILKEPFFI